MPCAINDIESLSLSSTTLSVTLDDGNVDKRVKPSQESLVKFVPEFIDIVNQLPQQNKDGIDKIYSKLNRQYHIVASKSDIRQTYQKFFRHKNVSPLFKKWMIKKASRADSGVLVATMVLSPHEFSCKYKCSYCPQETDLNGVPTQPKSYLSTEPAMLRAIGTRTSTTSYDFDIKSQFQNRIQAYKAMGNIDQRDTESKKMEVILSGGTWESYPIEYREKVILEVYWSANTMSLERSVKTLEEEIKENETAEYRIIGLTLETRPDNITKKTICDYVRWGVTRIQIGVQHLDYAILKKVNRMCYAEHTEAAIRLLKQAGFKVVVHLMPDLPGSSPALDYEMFTQVLTDPRYQFDDVKIYPTAVCKSPDPDRIVTSKIADWYAAGLYKPYAEKNLGSLLNVLAYYKSNVQPWVRIQRLVRDIPGKSIESGYNKVSNLRQVLEGKMKEWGLKCQCIYCMEIGDKELDDLTPYLVVREYKASEGTEYHISMESHQMKWYDKVLYNADRVKAYLTWSLTGEWNEWQGNLETYTGLFGFCRLRIDPAPGGDFIPEINGCGLIREVHVYGFSLGVGKDTIGSQHRGFGQQLVKTAEQITSMTGLKKTAVIAGVGTREYYKNKCGYQIANTYMVKNLLPYNYNTLYRTIIFMAIVAGINAVIHSYL
jgi:ELP3 family radical SAM enzyme/protein acetyltransferase